MESIDYGSEPFVVNIDEVTIENDNYRTALWTGKYLQATLMNIEDEIGLEVHSDTDQFLRVEEGCGIVMMGDSKDNLTYEVRVEKDYAVFVPAGTWHNIVNCGSEALKLYTIYAPPHHEHGVIQHTRADAE